MKRKGTNLYCGNHKGTTPTYREHYDNIEWKNYTTNCKQNCKANDNPKTNADDKCNQECGKCGGHE